MTGASGILPSPQFSSRFFHLTFQFVAIWASDTYVHIIGYLTYVRPVQLINYLLKMRDGNSVVHFSDRTSLSKYDTDAVLLHVATDRLI